MKKIELKELKIVDYFNGMNRLNRYIKKSKARFKRANKHGFQTKAKNSLITPYKKSLLNVEDIFKFVNIQKEQEDQEADTEAITVHEKAIAKRSQLDDKEKWGIVMEYMSKNPRILLDALPDPDEDISKTMYSPAYDEIIDQENVQQNSNIVEEEMNEEVDLYSQDALALGAHNNEFGDGSNVNSIPIIHNKGEGYIPDSIRN
eukprot:CAMPEP_0205805792 /NCGR_PEP_ID=MMETSP0205-20121125/9125_1 /ASSEMBLY_ACC=CAM_ASM_000278 /TAXON_ID=36767 /ORGANISM="Euplotes focardii, Strain TN1" /LENGTH=202 /DNA_ID=CAMNT_0053077583 /DNA_START=55 /DNA_END=661 /DNA_ORIENTATION=+